MSSKSAGYARAQIKYSVPFTSDVNTALLQAAASAHVEVSEIIQRATIKKLIDDGFIEKTDADRVQLFWALVDAVVEAAQNRCRANRFTSSITLEAIRECMADPTNLPGQTCNWTDGYREYVGHDIFKSGIPEKGPINREIGLRVRVGIGGIVEKDERGKSKNIKVLGEIIQTFTPFADFDRVTFKPTVAPPPNSHL